MIVRVKVVGFLAQNLLPGRLEQGDAELAEGTTLEQALAVWQIPLSYPCLVTVNGRRAASSLILREGDLVCFVPLLGVG